MKARRILHEKTQRFLRGRWRREEGVYINEEQRWGKGFEGMSNRFSGKHQRTWWKCCGCHEKWTAPPRVRLRPCPQWHACPVYIEIPYRTISLQVTEPQCCACNMKWTTRSVLTPSRSVSTLSKMSRLSGFWHVRVRFRPPVQKGDLTLRVRFRPSGRVRFRPPAPLALWDALKLWDALALFKDRACLHFPIQWNLKYQIKEIAFWISDGMFSTYM